MGRTPTIILAASSSLIYLILCGRSDGEDARNRSPASRPASAPADDRLIRAAESLEAVAQSLVPKGWSVSPVGEHVIIERDDSIEVFNAISLPYRSNTPESREYIRSQLRRLRFRLSMRVSERMLQNGFDLQSRKNSEAIERARREERDPKLIPDDAYWHEHPKYGYQDIPWLDGGNYSVYAECSVYWMEEFLDADVCAECDGVVKALAAPFRAYQKDFQFFRRSSRK